MTRPYGVLQHGDGYYLHPYFGEKEQKQVARMPYVNLIDHDALREVSHERVQRHVVRLPDTEFRFVHESAIIEYNGVLFVAWYSCPEKELQGYTPIHGARSFDGGKTWTEKRVWAHDAQQVEMYCPPVFGICDGELYLFVNSMHGFDNITAMEVYRWNAQTETFDFCRRNEMCFKLNTNMLTLSNGKRLLPGRSGVFGKNPLNPAVLISDSGAAEGDWRLVVVDTADILASETTVLEENGTLYMFCRNGGADITRLYLSLDGGETWSSAASHDIPLRSVKMYVGTLADGRHYVIGNAEASMRHKIILYLSEPHELRFTKYMVLYDMDAGEPYVPHTDMCHYPCVWETNGRLYISLTLNYTDTDLGDNTWLIRGISVYEIDLTDFD
ncbi:MAG: exo-alpha-sialidase [Clostridia bacterium]|nr:exo-alpha-sialidase [Clostridia bacterium]